jgi:RHS repeat-associated protein
MTTMPAVSNWTTAQTLKWDAWNRLVKVSEASTTIAEYSYDAIFRRVTKVVDGTSRRFYYSDQWQILEEYVGTANNPDVRYWYGNRDINDIARRQRYSSGISLRDDLYALRETMNVVALVNASGIITQRTAFDAFGDVRFMTSTFAADTNAVNWNQLFHAHYRDAETGLYQMRLRYYHPIMGVWQSRDPLLEMAGINLNRFLRDNPVNSVDYYGQIETIVTPVGGIEGIRTVIGQRFEELVHFLGVLVVIQDALECIKGVVGLPKPECFCTKTQQAMWIRESIDLYKEGSEKCIAAAVGALTLSFKKLKGVGPLVLKGINWLWKLAADFQSDEFVVDTFLRPLPPVDAHCGKRACYTRTPPWSDRYKPDSDPWDANARWWNPYDQSWHHWSEAPPGSSSGPPVEPPRSW